MILPKRLADLFKPRAAAPGEPIAIVRIDGPFDGGRFRELLKKYRAEIDREDRRVAAEAKEVKP